MWGVPVDFPLNQWDALSKTATIAAMEDWPTCNPFDLFASPHRSCEIQSGVNQWDFGAFLRLFFSASWPIVSAMGIPWLIPFLVKPLCFPAGQSPNHACLDADSTKPQRRPDTNKQYFYIIIYNYIYICTFISIFLGGLGFDFGNSNFYTQSSFWSQLCQPLVIQLFLICIFVVIWYMPLPENRHLRGPWGPGDPRLCGHLLCTGVVRWRRVYLFI